MAYFLALPNGDKYTIASESFSVRSNAEKYAKRMGWTRYFVATEEQKAIIESGGGAWGGASSVMNTSASTSQYPQIANLEPDSKLMKEEGIPWDKKGRRAKKK